jgi:hypothetical protein
VAVIVKLDTTPVQLHTTPFQTQVRLDGRFFVLIGTCWRRSNRAFRWRAPRNRLGRRSRISAWIRRAEA